MPRRNYFSVEALDRAAHLRRDVDWLAGRLSAPETRLLLMQASSIPLDGERGLAFLAGVVEDIDHTSEGVVFLGVDPDGAAVFAIDTSDDVPPALAGALPEGHTYVDLRGAASMLPAEHGHRAAYASAMLTWHRRHRWCGTCGAAPVPDWAATSAAAAVVVPNTSRVPTPSSSWW